MSREPRNGDRVSWDTPQGRTQGTVERKLTSRTKVQEHQVDASEDEPQYLVKSEKTGKLAAHRPGALRRLAD